MARILVSTVLDAPPAEVWEELRHIDRHVEWMLDAESIHFTSETTAGTGTTFECTTKVGPIRLLDVMEITEWVDERLMGVRHTGVVTGTGRFTLKPVVGGRTRFTWDEELRFPWWMGGPVGGVAGARVMRLVWRRNLANLQRRLRDARPPARPA